MKIYFFIRSKCENTLRMVLRSKYIFFGKSLCLSQFFANLGLLSLAWLSKTWFWGFFKHFQGNIRVSFFLLPFNSFSRIFLDFWAFWKVVEADHRLLVDVDVYWFVFSYSIEASLGFSFWSFEKLFQRSFFLIFGPSFEKMVGADCRLLVWSKCLLFCAFLYIREKVGVFFFHYS